MTRGVHVLNRTVLGLLGLLLLAVAAVLAAATSGAVPRVGGLWSSVADGVRSQVSALAASTSERDVAWGGAVVAAVLAVLAFAWVVVQRRGSARTGVVAPSDDEVPGEVVVTASAVEGLVHGLVRPAPDVLGASVTAVRRRRRTPRYDVVVAPRRGADPAALAATVSGATERAGRLLGVPVDRTVRLRASAVRRLRKARRVS